MKALLAIVALAVVAWWLHRRVKRRAYEDGPNYVAAIQSWTPDTPLNLPPIRALKAQRATPRLRRMR